MYEKNRLRAWALQADVIASQYSTHHYRQKLIRALLMQIEHYKHINRPFWHDTLLSMFDPLIGAFPVSLSHTEVKAQLSLIRDTCFYIADNFDDHYHSWFKVIYNHNGDEEIYKPFASSLWISDDDDTKPINIPDDSPL